MASFACSCLLFSTALADEEEKESFQNIQVIYVAENYKTFLDKIPDNSVGLVELDPPYAIGFDFYFFMPSEFLAIHV